MDPLYLFHPLGSGWDREVEGDGEDGGVDGMEKLERMESIEGWMG